ALDLDRSMAAVELSIRADLDDGSGGLVGDVNRAAGGGDRAQRDRPGNLDVANAGEALTEAIAGDDPRALADDQQLAAGDGEIDRRGRGFGSVGEDAGGR